MGRLKCAKPGQILNSVFMIGGFSRPRFIWAVKLSIWRGQLWRVTDFQLTSVSFSPSITRHFGLLTNMKDRLCSLSSRTAIYGEYLVKSCRQVLLEKKPALRHLERYVILKEQKSGQRILGGWQWSKRVRLLWNLQAVLDSWPAIHHDHVDLQKPRQPRMPMSEVAQNVYLTPPSSRRVLPLLQPPAWSTPSTTWPISWLSTK